jgi:glycosyltransferase involved in cell wall biosynthesis
MRGVEILHGHNLHHFSPAPALAIERLRQTFRLRVHHTFHETWPDILSREPVYRDWDGNYAISQYIQNQCRDLIGFRPNVLHPGVDTARFLSSRNCFSDSSIATILHPARLLPWKGVHISIQMLRLVLDAGFNARLIITDTQKIADWNRQLIIYREEILRLIAELHLEKYVKLVRATFADMPRLYNSADIVVYPTIAGEPYGLVPPEAMSCGRPVVASRCGGIPETVVHGVTGFLVDPGDVAALAQGVVLLLRDHSLAQRLGAAGRSRVKECFSTQKHISALLNRYGPAEDEA